jgi:hypothetical protein
MSHLSPEEFADALDGALSADRRAHLETCAACRAEVAELRSMLDDVATETPAHEPSPLFWERFPDRVRSAVGQAGSPGWWLRDWRTVASLAVATAAVVLVAVVRFGAGTVPRPLATGGSGGATGPSATIEQALSAEAEPWGIVVGAAAELPTEVLQDLPAPAPGSADVLVEDLTMDERAELLRLLKAEIGGVQ